MEKSTSKYQKQHLKVHVDAVASNLPTKEEGATMLEYVLLVSICLIGMIVSILGVRGSLSTSLSAVGSAVSSGSG